MKITFGDTYPAGAGNILDSSCSMRELREALASAEGKGIIFSLLDEWPMGHVCRAFSHILASSQKPTFLHVTWSSFFDIELSPRLHLWHARRRLALLAYMQSMFQDNPEVEAERIAREAELRETIVRNPNLG